MPLTNGTRIGQYEIVAALGEGGMGEVYRARDMRLKRDVAIKVLPDLWAHDADRLARFQREAEVLATLNHPRVAAIYGLEETKTATAIVMELVEGETLAERIARGPMAIDDVVTVARQVADALEAAHERGIVHRDLKPSNIKISATDSVKVLDFGLAKLTETATTASSLSMSPTLTVPGTYAGTILGTAAYMSPEQARGKPVDRRTDIWAFGCVLFEMLTGRQAFDAGETVSDAVAAILRADPDWNTLPPDTPPQLRTLMKRCLQKDAQKRLPHIGLVRVELDDPALPVVLPPAAKASRWRFVSFGVAGLILGIALTAAGAWIASRFATQPPLEQTRFSIVSPASAPLRPGGGDVNVAISPDGRQIVYVTAGESGFARAGGDTDGQLWIRSLDQPEPLPLRGITGRYPFFSPDGKWIGFFQAGFELNKVAVSGGPAVHLCHVDGSPRGGTWGPDKTIVYGTIGGALWLVPDGGGEPRRASAPGDGTLRRVDPIFLPNGRTVLFMLTPGSGLDAQIVALDVATRTEKPLIPGGGNPAYVDGGFLVYSVQGTLRAVRFDPDTLAVSGDAVPILQGVMAAGGGAAEFALSRNGTLVYVPGEDGGSTGAKRSLVWVDRRGMETPTGAEARDYAAVRLSPDGANVALDVRDQGNGDIWTFNFERKIPARLTTDPAPDMTPVYTPDGRYIVFASSRDPGHANIFRRPADGTGTDERLTTSTNFQQPTGFTPLGDSLLIREDRGGPSREIRVVSMDPSALKDGKASSQPLIHSSFRNESADVSPDGHWIAYSSNESGIPQVYVRPFPNVNDGRSQISTAGGAKPAWAHNGHELFYLDGDNWMWVVDVQTTPVFKPGMSKKLFQGPWFIRQSVRTYDVSRDDQHFLMIKDAPGDGRSAAASVSLEVWVNWAEELKQHVGGR
jgi:serine/threonine-protein kinase